MDCKDCREILDAYVDGELTALEHIAVDKHVANCAGCRKQWEERRAAKAATKSNADYHRAPDALRVRIDAALAARDSAQRGEARGKPRTLAWRWPALGFALASLVLFVAAGAVLLAQPSREDKIAEQIVASHVRSLLANNAVDVASSDQHTVKPWFAGKLDFSPPVFDLTTEGFPLVGGRVDYVDQRSVAALVYRHRQHTINVFVLPAKASIDEALSERLIQGYHILHWTRGGMSYWAISDVDAAELAKLSAVLRQQG